MTENEAFSERLQKARRDAGFNSPREAANAFGWNVNTYKSRENAIRGIPSQAEVKKYARAFGVGFIWLLTGEDAGERINTISVLGYVGPGAIVEPSFEQEPSEGLGTIDLPLSLPEGLIGFEVQGESMMPRYDEGDVIVVWKDQRRPVDTFYGEEAAVRTFDGRSFLKIIARGNSPSVVTLNSFNAKPVEDVRIEWVGEIYFIIRSNQIRRFTTERAARGSSLQASKKPSRTTKTEAGEKRQLRRA